MPPLIQVLVARVSVKLSLHLKEIGLTQAEYGDRIGKSQQAIQRYCDDRIPARDVMLRIYVDTNGMVTPNDFYNLPDLRAANDDERAA